MKRGYLAISSANRGRFDKEVEGLKNLFRKKGMELLVFVDEFQFEECQEKEMMKVAFNEIDKADFLIAELTTKSIGVGIEMGYAYARQKPIIYLRRKSSNYSATAAGSATFEIEYTDPGDLIDSFESLIHDHLS